MQLRVLSRNYTDEILIWLRLYHSVDVLEWVFQGIRFSMIHRTTSKKKK